MGKLNGSPKWPWRDHLTEVEACVVAAAEAAKAEWERLSAQKAFIQNRAIQRAKYAAGRDALADPATESGGAS